MHLLRNESYSIENEKFEEICRLTDGIPSFPSPKPSLTLLKPPSSSRTSTIPSNPHPCYHLDSHHHLHYSISTTSIFNPRPTIPIPIPIPNPGYSGADLTALCREAAYGPIRSLPDITAIESSNVRPISFEDFKDATAQIRASVSEEDLHQYLEWNERFGSFPIPSPSPSPSLPKTT